MPRPRSAMRKIREILRLSLGSGLSRRQVATATGSPYSTVSDHLGRAGRAGLGWPLPDWPLVHRELRRAGVTLQLLWMEYGPRGGSTAPPSWASPRATG